VEQAIKRFFVALGAFGLASVFASAAETATGLPRVSVANGLVTVRVADAPLVEVVQELGRRAGFEVIADPSDESRISVTFEGIELREAIRRVCKTTGYIEVLDPTTGRVARLVLTPSKPSPVARVSERKEPYSPRPAPEPPVIEPDPQQPPEAEQAPERRAEAEPPAAEEAAPAEQPQIFPEPFADDERSDDRRRAKDKGDD
jgi:hypothetical protein